jgi:hypothetical protein
LFVAGSGLVAVARRSRSCSTSLGVWGDDEAGEEGGRFRAPTLSGPHAMLDLDTDTERRDDPMSQPQKPDPGRIYLDVPYAEKDAAKALGARWDSAAKRWYDPRPPTPGLDRWAARPEVPELLPGEDRSFGGGLFVDMVPSSCWFTNVRSCVSQQDWERLRRMVTQRAANRCEACGDGENRDVHRWLEVHERWHYDETTATQTLRRLICLCTDCHQTTHLGLANLRGHAAQALAHLQSVTGMTPTEANQHVAAANQLWLTRSTRTWTLDLSMLTTAGITLARPGDPAERQRQADQQLTLVRAQHTPVLRPQRLADPPIPPKLPSRTELLAEAHANRVVQRLINRINPLRRG